MILDGRELSKSIKENIKKDFIVENFMKSNGLYCLVARPKVGKSLLALQLANAIATGIITDTGVFQYSSVTSDTFEFAAQLLRKGVNISKICHEICHEIYRDYRGKNTYTEIDENILTFIFTLSFLFLKAQIRMGTAQLF